VFRKVRAKVFIDCSYEGDLMAAAGVSYLTGRESNAMFGETYNGWQLLGKHQFPDGIDPYRKPGDPASGLLWGVSAVVAGAAGSGDSTGAGDKRIQAYNFRLCLTDDPADKLPIEKPARYEPDHYELLVRVMAARPEAGLTAFLNINLMPNHKTDINNNGPFSTDMIGMNYDYPEGSYTVREKIWRAHEDYTKGLLYFLGHDPRVPAAIRSEMLKWGYPKDEFVNSDHWTPQLYIREARRMNGEYMMTQANCQGKVTVPDGIGLAAYTMDSHNCERLVVHGMVKNEGDVQIGGFGPYPVAYRSITPKAGECTNLLVPVCLSATHIAYGSIRMEPVFMVLGESAAVAAHLAIGAGCPVQQVDVTRIRELLRTDTLRSFFAGATILNARPGRMKNWIIMMKHPRLGRCVLNFAKGMTRYELDVELDFLRSYEGRLPVPRVLDHGEDGETSYLLTSMIKGEPRFQDGDFCIPNLIIHRGNLNGIVDRGRGGSGDLYRDQFWYCLH
jgi:hypothetical protein